MASQIDNRAAPGSLLKQPRALKPKKGRRSARVEDSGYLALIRRCPCLACGLDPAGTAAHVRMSSAAHGKPNAGMQTKPDDSWATPLCHEDHMRQHDVGELSFWHDLGLNPVLICVKLQKSGSLEAMRAVCFAVHESKETA